ncbi:hypothetical protein SASPL_105050 [Salvia splendens]|uniref:Solute carrier family 25 (Mitochondrial iron transporter), member 28/37 n=1 Tax=Salvia splendens TaxID=180675 RepID=A0A8X9AAD5_SALSN|nr:hypothetical protein SASPL_105050 [Salvia splendens]
MATELLPDYTPAASAAADHDGLQFCQFMIAGSVACTVEHMAMFPIDTVKTRMQALGSCLIWSATVAQAAQSILKSDGVIALGAGPVHSAYFTVYEACKRHLSRGDPDSHAASGVCATVASDAVLTPMDVVKVARQDGIGAFYASYRTTVLMNAPFTALHFAAYEAAKRGLTEVSDYPEALGEETLVVHATAGAAAGALAAAFTTPLDVVKTQ